MQKCQKGLRTLRRYRLEQCIEEKEQEGSSDAMISKDKEIIAAAEKLQ